MEEKASEMTPPAMSSTKYSKANTLTPPNTVKEFLNAIGRYDSYQLKQMLESDTFPNINSIRDDAENGSALHVLFRDGFLGHLDEKKMLECLKVLLHFRCDVNSIDKNGESPLSLAVFNGFESCAKILVQKGAETSIRTPCFPSMHSLSTTIGMKMPDVMVEILNSGVVLRDPNGKVDPDTKVEFNKSCIDLDFNQVIQKSEDPSNLVKYGITKKKYMQRETSFLYSLLDLDYETRRKYLTHPLVEAFMDKKGKIISSKLLWFQLIMTFYPIIYMAFIYFLYFNHCKIEREDQEESSICQCDNNSSTSTTTAAPKSAVHKQGCEITSSITVSAYCLAVVVLGFALVEVFMLLRVDTKYLRSWRNWVMRVTLVIMGCTLWPALQFKDVYNISWQYPIAALGTFFAWVMFLIQMELVPQVKVYLEMLVSIILSVLQITILFLPLLAGFYMGFNLMFFEIGNIMTFILMTVDVGSNEYEDMIESAKDSKTWFTIISYIFTVAFIIVIAIVFMNFLLGVSIDDIQQLKKNAKIMALSNKVQSFFVIDLLFPMRYRVVQGENYSYGYDPRSDKLPERIRTKLILLLRDRYALQEENENVCDYSDLTKRMDGIESKLNSLLDAVQMQVERL